MESPFGIGGKAAVLALAVAVAGGCVSDGNLAGTSHGINLATKSQTVYFGGFAGYDTPLKLVERLSRSEALSRPVYLVGDYDGGGRLQRVEKYFGDERHFRQDYSYHANGEVKESRFVGVDGKERVQHYDESGDLIDADGNRIESPFLPKT